MDYFREVFEFFSKAKDIRLNVAVFLASSTALGALKKEWILISDGWVPLLELVTFLTSVRILARILGLAYEKFESRKSAIEKAKLDSELARRNEVAEADKLAAMRADFARLDIYQLKIIQDLKKANTTHVKKGAPLFTLKHMQIVNSAASNPTTESVLLTARARRLLEDGLWDQLEDLKYSAAHRFFSALDGDEAKAFKQFSKRDSIYTKIVRANRSTESWEYRIFSKHGSSTLFTQPQIGYSYEIDGSAKKALLAACPED
ncbi:hypothetical protein ACTHGN_000945 [Pseudomonas putida]